MQQCAVVAEPSTPMPKIVYDGLLEKAGKLDTLNKQLPKIQEITTCKFVDNAFRKVVDTECPDLEAASLRLAAAALISAVALTITSFYFCICVQYAP
jgi:hypothetical protein